MISLTISFGDEQLVESLLWFYLKIVMKHNLIKTQKCQLLCSTHNHPILNNILISPARTPVLTRGKCGRVKKMIILISDMLRRLVKCQQWNPGEALIYMEMFSFPFFLFDDFRPENLFRLFFSLVFWSPQSTHIFSMLCKNKSEDDVEQLEASIKFGSLRKVLMEISCNFHSLFPRISLSLDQTLNSSSYGD